MIRIQIGCYIEAKEWALRGLKKMIDLNNLFTPNAVNVTFNDFIFAKKHHLRN